MELHGFPCYSEEFQVRFLQCSKWVGIYRCTIPELTFVPKFLTGSYQCIVYPLIFFPIFLMLGLYHCFTFYALLFTYIEGLLIFYANK
jgi:hypothetical protein